MKTLIKQAFFVFFMIISFFPVSVFASQILLSATNRSITVEEEFIMQIYVDTQGESINALEGVLRFPSDILEIKDIRDGDSIINFWIKHPSTLQEITGELSFSGIIPGGYKAGRGHIVSIIFKAKKQGNGVIAVTNARILNNDDNSTEGKVISTPFSFSVKETQGLPASVIVMEEHDVPEKFTIQISRDPSLFDGKYFAVFATQDKGSGIDHYELREGFFGKFIRAESPHVLQDQDLHTRIYVKAIDKDGNELVESMNPSKNISWYVYVLTLSLLVIILAVPSFLRKRLRFLHK
jgi:hypothetical protein